MRIEAMNETDWAALRNLAAHAGWKEARKHDLPIPVSDAISLAVAEAIQERILAWQALR